MVWSLLGLIRLWMTLEWEYLALCGGGEIGYVSYQLYDGTCDWMCVCLVDLEFVLSRLHPLSASRSFLNTTLPEANILQRQNTPEGEPLRCSSMDTTPEPSHWENYWHPVRVNVTNDENEGHNWNRGSDYREQHGPGRRRSNDEFGSARYIRRRRNGFGSREWEYFRRCLGLRRREPRSMGLCTMKWRAQSAVGLFVYKWSPKWIGVTDSLVDLGSEVWQWLEVVRFVVNL